MKVFENTSKLQGGEGGAIKMGDKLSSFPALAALEVFPPHLNALVLSLILLHEF